MVDGVLEVFLADDVTAENFDEVAAIESSPGIDVIGAYEVNEYVVLPLQEGTSDLTWPSCLSSWPDRALPSVEPWGSKQKNDVAFDHITAVGERSGTQIVCPI